MKILLVVSSDAPNVGGLQTVTGKLARELHARGHEVNVIANRYPRTLAPREVLDDVPVIRWHFVSPRLQQLLDLRFDLFLAGFLFFPLTLIRLVSLLRRSRPDVVNLHFVGAPALFVLLARWLLSFRLIVSLHGDDVEGLGDRKGFDRWVFGSILRRADLVTACSRYLLERAALAAPVIRRKGRVIYNGIDPGPILVKKLNSGGLLAAGRLVSKKGFDVLLRAQAHGGKKWQLTLIGDGPERGALKLLASKLGLNGDVTFLHSQAHTKVLEAMAACDLVVIPSRQEPFGMVALEAMGVGKPIVAARVGGLPEVLEGAEASLVEPENSEALANAISETLVRLGRDPNWGARNREHAARFSLEQMVCAYEATYGGSNA